MHGLGYNCIERILVNSKQITIRWSTIINLEDLLWRGCTDESATTWRRCYLNLRGRSIPGRQDRLAHKLSGKGRSPANLYDSRLYLKENPWETLNTGKQENFVNLSLTAGKDKHGPWHHRAPPGSGWPGSWKLLSREGLPPPRPAHPRSTFPP